MSAEGLVFYASATFEPENSTSDTVVYMPSDLKELVWNQEWGCRN